MNAPQFKHWLVKTQPDRKYMVNSSGQGIPVLGLNQEMSYDCLKYLFTYLLKFIGHKILSIDQFLDMELQNMDNTPILSDMLPNPYISYSMDQNVYGILEYFFETMWDNFIINANNPHQDPVNMDSEKYGYSFKVLITNTKMFGTIRKIFSMDITDDFVNYVIFDSPLIEKCIICIKKNIQLFQNGEIDMLCPDLRNYIKKFDY